VKELDSDNISIDKVTNNIIKVYVNDAQYYQLDKYGYRIEKLPNSAKLYAKELMDLTRDSDNPMRSYFTYEEYIDFMYETAEQYPEICELYSAGLSVESREILFLKIALLTTGYGVDDRLTNMVNNTELYINPLMNPDGYYAVERVNANGVDLNRHFPDSLNDPNNSTYGREPEVAAIMDFTFAHNFSMAMNFHTGALVINYPYDNTYDLAPDDDLLYNMAISYAENNLPMYSNPEFTNGVTNGAAWYVVYGTMQDWNYYFMDSMAMTAEVSNIKWPPENQLDGLWEDNQESLLTFIENSQTAISGIVTNDSGENLLAEIQILDNAHTIMSDQENGSFNRLLNPGIYTVSASAYGHQMQTIEDIEVVAGQHTTVNFQLIENDNYQITGLVKDVLNQPISGAEVFVTATQSVFTEEDGTFLVDGVYEGTNHIMITKDGYCNYSSEIIVDEDNTDFSFVLLLPAFMEDFSSDNWQNEWILESTWNSLDIDGNTVLTDSPEGSYSNDQDNNAILIAPINLDIATYCQLSFNTKFDLESTYDYAYFETSNNGISWSQKDSFSGNSNWINKNYDLSDYCGGSLFFRFRIVTDASVTGDGIFIDDILISADNVVDNIADNQVTPLLYVGQNYPNPIINNSKTKFPIVSNLKGNDSVLEIYNIKGQIVKQINLDNQKSESTWNATNNQDEKVASGIYFYRIKSDKEYSNIKKMIVIK